MNSSFKFFAVIKCVNVMPLCYISAEKGEHDMNISKLHTS